MPMRGIRTVLLLATVMLAAAACGSTGSDSDASATASSSSSAADDSESSSANANPLAASPLFTWYGSKAAAAVPTVTGEDQAIVQRIASTPTAIWLTPEEYPAGTVGTFVSTVLEAASGRLPVFVVYGIPSRDCAGGHSSGGLSTAEYTAWVQDIADALTAGDVDSATILEPDALPSAPGCGLVPEREELLSTAVGQLADATTVYVDAGHANWTDTTTMAQMLSAIGVDRVRGFSVNVSGYDDDASERAYAEALRAQLPSAHYVIDSSRNGVGGTGEWCNPPGRALGLTPGATEDGGGLDAHLWVKPPGESDGTCNGGPVAGTFWTERAVDLAREAGWMS
ncbi:MAG: glycoside hydrolase family 6 protein [Nocardioides sp.]|uniref:glycoside hydrolase family 6 protein n=1 Tax=Nocardioides sp. TaxID=35761 RepID=UPI0039E25E37